MGLDTTSERQGRMNDELREQSLEQIRMTFPMLFSTPTAAHRNSFALKSVNMKSDKSTEDTAFTLVRDDDEKVEVPAESFVSVQSFKRAFLSFGIIPTLTGYQISELFAQLYQYCVAFGVAEVIDTVSDYCDSLFSDYWHSATVVVLDYDGDESTDHTPVNEMLRTLMKALEGEQICLLGGRYYFTVRRMATWMKTSGAEPLSENKLGAILREWGAERKHDTSGQFRYWTTPRGYSI